MLTLLQSLSSVPSTHPQDEEAPPPRTSSGSTRLQEQAVLPPGMSNVLPQSSGPLPTTAPRDAPLDKNINAAKSSRGILMLKRLLPTRIRKSNKGLALHGPNRVRGGSRQATDHQPRPSPARVEHSNAGPSTIAAARPKRVRASLIDDRMRCDQYIILASGCDIFQSATASVVQRSCMQGLISHCSVNRLPSPPSRTKLLLVADKALQFRPK